MTATIREWEKRRDALVRKAFPMSFHTNERSAATWVANQARAVTLKEIESKLKWAEQNRNEAMDNERIMRERVEELVDFAHAVKLFFDEGDRIAMAGAMMDLRAALAKFKGEGV